MEKQIFACCLRGMRKNDGSGSVSPCPEGLKIIKCCFLGADPPFLKPTLHKESKNGFKPINFPVNDFLKLLFSVPKIVKKVITFKKGGLHPRNDI